MAIRPHPPATPRTSWRPYLRYTIHNDSPPLDWKADLHRRIATLEARDRRTVSLPATAGTGSTGITGIYRMLRYGQNYVDIGEKAYEAQFEARRLASLKEAARGLGFTLVEDPLPKGQGFKSERR